MEPAMLVWTVLGPVIALLLHRIGKALEAVADEIAKRP